MTEQQLREKLQFAYGNMPDATRAAFEYSLTHHRAPETHRSIGLSRTMRIVITAVLMALMLTAVGVAAARFFSVTDVHPAQDGTEGDYQAHYLALEERYDSDLLSVSVNDAVYDGSVLAFTMEMAAKTDDVLAVEVRICGECDGKMYRFDPLDVYGGEFQSLLMLPDLGGTFDGEKYAAEGILLDENGQMPPEGKPIAWTIEIDVLKAVWQTETMPDDLYEALSEEDDVAQYIREQAEQHMITLTDAGVEDYLLEMCGAGWDEIEQMSKGGFAPALRRLRARGNIYRGVRDGREHAVRPPGIGWLADSAGRVRGGCGLCARIVPRRVRGAALRSAEWNGTAEWDGTAGCVANLPQRRAESGG